MKRIVVILQLLSMFASQNANAQVWGWAHDTSYLYVEESGAAQNVAADNFGNLYCAGAGTLFRHNAITGEIKWSMTTTTDYLFNMVATDNAGYVYYYENATGSGYNIKKIDSLGNLVRTINGYPLSSGYISPYKISMDGIGHFYLSGYCVGTGIVAGTDTIMTSTPYNSWMTKYDTSGKIMWGYAVSSLKNVVVYGVVGDTDGNYYVMGTVDTSILTIGDTTVSLPYVGENIFVAKCDSNHHLLWVTSNKHLRGFFYTDRKDYQINIDGAGNVYVAGSFFENDTIGTKPLSYTSSGVANVFVAKYETLGGNVEWAKTGHGSIYRIYSFATNSYGNSYLIYGSTTPSYFGDSVYTFIGPGSTITPNTIIGLDSSGNISLGFLLGGRTGDDEIGIAIDKCGNGYICGDYIDSCWLGGLSLYTGAPPGGYEAYFAAKFNSAFGCRCCSPETNSSIIGDPILCKGNTTILSDTTSGGVWSSSNTSIATVGSGTGIVTGVSLGVVTITYTIGVNYSTMVDTVKLCEEEVSIVSSNGSQIMIYPNPTNTFLILSSSDNISSVAISNLLGQVMHMQQYNSTQVQVDVSNLPTGMYIVRINNTDVRKFVKQ